MKETMVMEMMATDLTETGVAETEMEAVGLGAATAAGAPTRSGAPAPESPPPPSLGAETARSLAEMGALPTPARAGFPECARDAGGRFLPGAPGRQLGQRNLLSGQVARRLLRDFDVDADVLLPRLKRWFLPQYIQLIAKLLPKNGSEGVAAADLAAALAGAGEMDAAARVAALREALAAAEAEAAAG